MDTPNTKVELSNRQKEIIVDCLEENPRLFSRKFDKSFNQNDKKTIWSGLTERLNKENPENTGDDKKWKTIVSNWKKNVKDKHKRLGLRGLSTVEKRLLITLGIITPTPKGEETPDDNVSSPITQGKESGTPNSAQAFHLDSDSNTDESIDETLQEDKQKTIPKVLSYAENSENRTPKQDHSLPSGSRLNKSSDRLDEMTINHTKKERKRNSLEAVGIECGIRQLTIQNEDPDMLFCRCLAEELRKIPEERKLSLKTKLLQVISDFKTHN